MARQGEGKLRDRDVVNAVFAFGARITMKVATMNKVAAEDSAEGDRI